ncbi:MAG TPA: hypothetical protein VNO32_32900 [Candidatus Acidoferrum sp.]|jgi:hypothetical protein|nr:hypothetical protein [Candidatus Acidoferrum sp.]
MNKAKVTGSLRGIPRGLENWGDLGQWGKQKSVLSGTALSTLAPLGILGLFAVLSWFEQVIKAHHPTAAKFLSWIDGAVGVIIFLVFVSGIIFVVVYHLRIRAHDTPKTLSR